VEAVLPSAGDVFKLSGTFHGPVLNKNTFEQAVTIVQGLPQAAPQREALEAALGELRALLEALPAASQPTAGEVAESAEKVVKAVAAQAPAEFFDRSAATLRSWAGALRAAAPRVLDTAEKIISLAANLRTLGG
jgi:hypothetical protein